MRVVRTHLLPFRILHRRLVREAVVQALPPDREPPQRQRPKLAPAIPFIHAILVAHRQAPRKQRHTAHRIFHRPAGFDGLWKVQIRAVIPLSPRRGSPRDLLRMARDHEMGTTTRLREETGEQSEARGRFCFGETGGGYLLDTPSPPTEV